MNQWNLTYLFKTPELFLQELESLKKYIPELASYQGKLKDESTFKDYLLLQIEMEKKLYKVYQYACLQSDLNKKNVENATLLSKVQLLLNQINQVTSFESPEILSLGEEKVFSILDKHQELDQYRFILEKLFHQSKHILDQSSERLLSFYSPLAQEGSKLYSTLSVADRKAKTITLSTKEKVVVTQGNWQSLIADSTNPKDRKKIFGAIFSYYEEHKNVYAEIYNTVMQAEKASMQARKFPSILGSHLDYNHIPISVFKNLIDVASKANASLKKYIQIRKNYLGLKNHYTYDRFIKLAHSNKKYEYNEAKELFFASISSCPQDFQDKAHEVLKEGFVDVYEKDGKRSGAYSSSMPDEHPFILLNYTNTLDDVFTLAHEAGHSIHSMYSMENQPTKLQDYTIFVAEIASTFNEHMLLDYFMKSANTSKEEKIMLLQKAIDEIMATFYRQALFANYEYEVSKMTEKDEPINYEILSNLMIRLYKKYYGIQIKKEKVKQFVWAYIPHLFYTPFYVYQYATSFAASFALYSNVKNKKENAFDNYTNLLKSGGSKYPVEQARDAGVDFTKKETFMAVVARMDELVDQLEQLIESED